MKFSDFLGSFRDLFLWLDQIRRTKKSVEEMENKLKDLSKTVEELVLQLEHRAEIEKLEREKLLLQMQNFLLTHSKKQLPPQD